MNDELGDRMKAYEKHETGRKFLPMLPIYARIDGRGFSKFTKGMRRPFDPCMTEAMVEVTKHLVRETHAIIGYVQSDEISLLWQQPRSDAEVFFDGKVQKMVSVLASMAAAKMAQVIRGWEPYEDRLPAFDARVLALPSQTEAANMILWRTMDATKNAVSMACRHYFSAKQMHGKSQQQMREMMIEGHGVNFENDFPPSFRYGTFVRRNTIERELTETELANIPEKHRPEPGALVTRTEMATTSMRFSTITNRTEYIFQNEDPVSVYAIGV